MKVGDLFKFTNKPDMGVYNEELQGITVNKIYRISEICVSGSEIFVDDEGQENYAASSSDGMLKEFVCVIE